MKRLRHPKTLYNLLWYGLAFVVITSAVLLTTARLLLPSMEGYRSVVEGFASEFIGQPVRIGGLDAQLIGLSPAFVFKDVALLTAPGEEPLVRAGQLRVEIDLLRSLRQVRPVMRRLLIGGVDLTLTRSADGEFRLSGPASPSDGSPDRRFEAWLLAQRNVVIRDSGFTWRDEASGRERRFQSVSVEVLNRGERHQLNAALTLPDSMGRRLRVALDLTGDPRRRESWNGELYLQADAVRPGDWFSGQKVRGYRFDKGLLDAALWSTWQEGRLVSVDGRVAANDFSVSGSGKAFAGDHASAAIRWRRSGEEWRLDLADLQFERGGKAWEPGRITLSHAAGRSRLAAAFLRVEDVAAALSLYRLPEEQAKLLAELAPGGDLKRVQASVENGGYQLDADFHDLSVLPYGKFPGLAGLDGKLQLRPATARIALNTRDATVDMPRLFEKELRFSDLAGRFAIERAEAGWQVQGRGITVSNADVSGALDLDFAVRPGQAPYIDLRGRFGDGRGEAVRDYLPVHIMPAATTAWLKNAIGGGRIANGTILLRGPASAFPFRKREGRFEVRFDAENVDLAFERAWPPLRQLAAEVVFDGPAMRITGRDGRFYSGRIKSADVRISDLRRARLMIDGRGELPAADVLRILRETPLAHRFGRTFEGSSAVGKTGIKLHLEFPLARRGEPEQAVVGGELALARTTLRMNRHLELADMDGVLRFDRDGLESNSIRGAMFGKPVRLAIQTRDGAIHFRADGRVSGKSLPGGLELPHLDRFTGETTWQGHLAVPQGKGEMTLRVTSNLAGMAVELPEPLAKTASERRDLVFRHHFAGTDHGYSELAYGDVLQAVFALDKGGLERGAFHFGSETPSLPAERALRVTGILTGIDPGAWGKVLKGGDRGGRPLPLQVSLHRLQLLPQEATEGAGSAGEVQVSALPPLTLHIENLELGQQRIGELLLKSEKVVTRTRFSELRLKGRHYLLQGSGEWIPRGRRGETRFDLRLGSGDIGAMMDELGFASVISDGKAKVKGHLSWSGTPTDFSLARLDGQLDAAIEDGLIDEIDVGGGRLLGLFSLAALPQRLRLDFTDVFSKGFTFHRMAGDLRFETGQLFTDNLQTDAASAKILMTGRTGLATKDYDLLVTVVPNVSDSIAVAGGLAMGPQAGALLWIVQKLFRIDEGNSFQYTVEGPWEAPEITRLPRARPGDQRL